MNPETSGGASGAGAPAAFKPYVSAETQMVESTVGAIVLGSILGIVFAAASVYAGLKVGLTTSASIPIGVLSITILKAFGKSTILKNNIVQTAGSAGESLAAGVAFTLPSLLLMGFEMDVTRITLIALLGGILGTLMMIPLRHSLIVKEHGKLPYPEGTACAQVLIVGEKGGSSAKSLFGGLFLGGLWAFLGNIGKLFATEPGWLLDKIRLPFQAKAVPFFKGASFSFETNPVLLGTGYIIGWRTSFIMLAGGVLSYLVLIPAVQFFGVDMTSPLIRDKTTGALIKASQMSPGQIRTAYVLYIGAGAVAAGGLISLAKALPTIFGAFTRGLSGIKGGTTTAPLRTERDLPMWVVLVGCVALVFAIWAPSLLKEQIGRDILGINWISAILILIFGFFFVTVSSRITGEIGSSSNPISGMTVATLLITCLLFVAVGRTGISYKEMALCTAALVCVAASNGGATSQALKCGHLLGATPRSQQIAITWGVITSAAVIGFTLMFLNNNYTTYHKFDAKDFRATKASIAMLAAQNRPDDLHIEIASCDFRGESWDVLYVRETQLDPAGHGDPNQILVPVGAYLIKDGAIVYRRDPGVCGTETDQLSEDGKTVERHIDGKFDAPKAQLFRLIIDGVLGGHLPWELVLIGVFISIMMELCGVPALAFAVGVYLPVSTSSSIFIGGLIRKWADKKTKLTEQEQESSPGVLCSSGMIAGGALIAILSCALLTPKTNETDVAVLDAAGKPTLDAAGHEITHKMRVDTTWQDDFTLFGGAPVDLALAHHLFAKDESLAAGLDRMNLGALKKLCDDDTLAAGGRDFLENHGGWSLGTFLLLGVLLYWVAAKKPKPENTATAPSPPVGQGAT